MSGDGKGKRPKVQSYRVWCHCGAVGTVETREKRDAWQTKHTGHSYTTWPANA